MALHQLPHHPHHDHHPAKYSHDSLSHRGSFLHYLHSVEFELNHKVQPGPDGDLLAECFCEDVPIMITAALIRG